MSFKDKFGTYYECDFDFENSDTLVLSGGALKCIYFLGALHKINNLKKTSCNFKYYAGTSCGAIVVSLLAAGYTPFEIYKEILKNTDFTLYNALDFTIQKVKELFNKKGLNSNITFLEFEQKKNCKLGFISTNVSKLREELLISKYHADTSIITAIKLSSALPIIFPIEKYKNNIFTDGIFFDNFPIKLSEYFKSENVIAITTLNSHYDKRMQNYYKDSKKYKIIMIPEITKSYFKLANEDKFKMFVTGYNYIEDNFNILKNKKLKKRRNSIN